MPDLFFDNDFRALIPPLAAEEYQELEQSLLHDGNRDAIVIWKERQIVIDGHNRYDLCQKNNIELKPPTELSFPDKDACQVWIIKNQFGRRNLSSYSRSVLALRLEDLFAKKAKANQIRKPESVLQISAEQKLDTRQEVATIAHVSHDTISKVKVIEARATPEQKARLVAGNATINKIYNTVKEDSNPPTVIVEQPQKNVTVICGDMLKVLPDMGKFDLIIADPPYNVTDFEWDKIPEFIKQTELWLTACKNALADKYHLFWFCSPRYSADIELLFRKLGLPIQSHIVWHRRNMAMGSQSTTKFIDSWEMIFHSGNTNLNIPGRWDDSRFDVQTFAVPQTNFTDVKLHPTQKPLDLIKWLIRYGSFPDSQILDPFAGSGTTGVACNGNKCLLIEQSEEYVKIANQRLGLS